MHIYKIKNLNKDKYYNEELIVKGRQAEIPNIKHISQIYLYSNGTRRLPYFHYLFSQQEKPCLHRITQLVECQYFNKYFIFWAFLC